MPLIRVAELTAPVTGVVPRARDRLRIVGTLLPRHFWPFARNLVLASVVVYGLGWEVAGGRPVAAAIAAVALALVLGWHLWLLRWAAGDQWNAHLLDLPRRRRPVAGPAPGAWATDVVPHGDRHAVLLLHFGERGDPSPPRAGGVPDVPWGHHARVAGGRSRTIVALEWADDAGAAQSAVARWRPQWPDA